MCASPLKNQKPQWNGATYPLTTSVLDPSLDASLSHTIARNQLKGLPSYVDQPDVIKQVRDN